MLLFFDKIIKEGELNKLRDILIEKHKDNEEKNTTKVVSINGNAKPAQKEEKKATYEELNNYCMQLFNQNKGRVNRQVQN